MNDMMAEEMAEQGAPVGGQTGGATSEQDMEAIQQIVELLLDGVDPNELVEQGIPVELIEAAIEIIMQQQQAAAPAPEEPMSQAGAGMKQPTPGAEMQGLAGQAMR